MAPAILGSRLSVVTASRDNKLPTNVLMKYHQTLHRRLIAFPNLSLPSALGQNTPFRRVPQIKNKDKAPLDKAEAIKAERFSIFSKTINFNEMRGVFLFNL